MFAHVEVYTEPASINFRARDCKTCFFVFDTGITQGVSQFSKLRLHKTLLQADGSKPALGMRVAIQALLVEAGRY